MKFISALATTGFLILFMSPAFAQKGKDVVVDKNGVMHWAKSGGEVRAFGINYTAMFAHAYRTAKKLNIPLEKAIDDDVYHFARLGFDAYRVHVWDCEISDTVGNLLNNDNLRLFDYTLAKMKERGMKFVITPIAYWGNGWPEPDDKTPGFSTKYGKGNCLTNPDAIKAQEKYLYQFVNHVNSYTKVAYKIDPDIIGFEISNEPHHGEAPEKVTTFIKRMITSIHATGCGKPIFYNISHSIHLEDAYFKAGIDGGTFQWYPTGLGAGHELDGNYLPHVDRYSIPFAANKDFRKIAKIVYEFDAADIGRSYIYPAMARSFREAGMQVATHFAYDPTFMANVNTEYGTHFMNLAYAPQKALSLMIAGEVFHRIPMYKNYGTYPVDTVFDGFHVSYKKDLAEFTSETKFLYTNNTSTLPPSTARLDQVAGFGNSPVVSYRGAGAYFLDRIEPGVWRLEVMPDALWIKDPFEKTSPTKDIAAVNWRTWPITISLPDLGEHFIIRGLNLGNTAMHTAAGNSFTISPGTYLLVKNGKTTTLSPESRWKNIQLNEFAAPAGSLKQTTVVHKPVNDVTAKMPLVIDASVFSTEAPDAVELHVLAPGFRREVIRMNTTGPYTYKAIIPSEKIQEGFLQYFIVVSTNNKRRTFPSGIEVDPRAWDFYDRAPYRVNVITPGSPIYLFDAFRDADVLVRPWLRTSSVVPLSDPGKAELRVSVEKLFTPDSENKDGDKIYDYSFRHYIGKEIAAYANEFIGRKKLIATGYSLSERPCTLQLALILKDGSAYGATVSIGSQKKEYEIMIDDLKPVKLVTLPRPYPTFLPYYFTGGVSRFGWQDVENLQFSIGPGIPESELQHTHSIAIENVRVE